MASIRACKVTPAGGVVAINSVYVADRLVLPTLSPENIAAIASGRHQMDAFLRRYIHENLSYRFVLTPDGSAAYALEKRVKCGEWERGSPLLNPGRRQ